MSMKKAFIGLGIAVMVVTGLIQSGVVDVEVFNRISASKMATEKLNAINTNPIEENGINTSSKSSSPQLPIDESQWEMVTKTTCTIDPETPWNNKDFKEGWCSLGTFEPGEYRFKVRSGLVLINNGGEKMVVPEDGLPTSLFRKMGGDTFADHFETYSPLQNKRVGMVIFRKNEEFPIPGREVVLDQKDTMEMSINFPATEANWKKMGFHGKITAQIFKKKT